MSIDLVVLHFSKHLHSISNGKHFEEETAFTSPNLADYQEKGTDSDMFEPAESREEKAMNFISYFELKYNALMILLL